MNHTKTEMKYCALEAKKRKEVLAGKAEIAHTFLLIEDHNAWGGRSAISNSILNEKSRERISEFDKCVLAPRILFIKKHDTKNRSKKHVYLCQPHPYAPKVKVFELDNINDIHKIDLVEESRSLKSSNRLADDDLKKMLLVCTHGKKDRCCAKIGGPVFQELKAYHDNVWQCTHTGGDRFAGNLVAPVMGMYFGFVYPEDTKQLANIILQDNIPLNYYRGATFLRPNAQAAEVFLRQWLDAPEVGRFSFILSDTNHRKQSNEYFFDWVSQDLWLIQVTRLEAEADVISGCSINGKTDTFNYKLMSIKKVCRKDYESLGFKIVDSSTIIRPIFRQDLTSVMPFEKNGDIINFPCNPEEEEKFFCWIEKSSISVQESKSGDLSVL